MALSILFDELPPKTKKAVKEILEHRQQMIKSGKGMVYMAATAPAGSALAMLDSESKNPVLVLAFSTASGVVTSATLGYHLLKGHDPATRREFLSLYRALKSEINHPAMVNIVRSKLPYLVIDSRGNLIPKKTAIQLDHRIPLGRRRVLNPA